MNGFKKTQLLLGLSLISLSSQAIEPCSKDWASEGLVKTSAIIWGVGISSNPDIITAKEEAKNRAFQDIISQIRSTVQSNSKLTDTDKATAFESLTSISSKAEDIIGIKTVREGNDPAQKLTACVGVNFNIKKAYEIPLGKMQALEKELKEVSTFVANKKWIEVIRMSKTSTTKIEAAKKDIELADLYKSFLMIDEKTWHEKFSAITTNINESLTKAKDEVFFLFPKGEHEIALTEIESQISAQGYKVLYEKPSKGLGIKLEIRQIGGIRKTKTALGQTLVAQMLVAVKDLSSGKDLATNKGTQVIGTGNDDDDALANIDRQLVSHIMQSFKQALPGVIEE